VSSSDLDARYAVAQEVIAEAADIALAYSRDLASLDIEAKGPQDLVSQADRQVEQHIRRRLTEAFPDDAFVGEESGRGGAQGAAGAWVVDPIDGTQPFLLGLPFWSVSIAYVVGDDVLIGLVMNPTSGDLYAARKGGGACVNGAPTRVIEATSLDQGVTGVGCSMRTHPDDLAHIMHGLLSQGGMYLGLRSGAVHLPGGRSSGQ
jgi:myo-inositol-1(or 4)-monophosphatase